MWAIYVAVKRRDVIIIEHMLRTTIHKFQGQDTQNGPLGRATGSRTVEMQKKKKFYKIVRKLSKNVPKH